MSPSDPDWEPFPPIPDDELPEWLIGAKHAMDRAIKKELELKRKLGQKIVIGKDKKVQVVDP